MMSRAITSEDRRRHAPQQTAPDNWQESFFLAWVDLSSLSAGSHHISLSPEKDTAHVWSWLVVNGKRVGRQAAHALSLPTDDLEDMQLGSLHFRAGETLRELSLKAEFAEGPLELDFKAICDPVEVDFNVGDTVLADMHYEAMGFATGQLTHDGQTIPINAAAWHDHSWGVRDFGTNPSSRWLFAIFGDDLAFSIFSFATSFGNDQLGWVYDAGQVFHVQRAEFHSTIANDGATPEAVSVDIWTEGGRGYRVSGTVLASGLTGGEGWFGVDGLTRFECGGRLGQGFFEPAELKGPTPAMSKELGLEE
tara:strand:+ start:3345 stop:4265 length:921 start_codon:yes stop_codon:yes gene_type:complete